MAQIVLAFGGSHGPSIQTPPEGWAKLGDGDTRDPRFDFQALLRKAKPGLERELTAEAQGGRYKAAHGALAQLREAIDAARLDVLLVISNQHRVYTDDQHAVFGVLRAANFPVTKRSELPFDPDARFLPSEQQDKSVKTVIQKPGHAALANHLIQSLIEDGFDIACLDQLRNGGVLDDAFSFPYDWLLGGASLPLVPFLLSRDLPNQATAKRCVQLGTALGKAIAAWPEDARVGLMASGGLSHQIVDDELDMRVVKALRAGDLDDLSKLPRERLNIGPGTPEILNWVTVAAAMAPKTMTLVDYLPCYRSLAGTGHGLAFGYWR